MALLMAKNMARARSVVPWMAVRDMDVAAEVIGIRIMHMQTAGLRHQFSFYCGVAGALYALPTWVPSNRRAFNLDLSFKILFMIIIGGVGSIMGSFGAAFIVLLPIFSTCWCRMFHRHAARRSPRTCS